jgi:hypothetical protein
MVISTANYVSLPECNIKPIRVFGESSLVSWKKIVDSITGWWFGT